jgi:hypothetical protein
MKRKFALAVQFAVCGLAASTATAAPDIQVRYIAGAFNSTHLSVSDDGRYLPYKIAGNTTNGRTGVDILIRDLVTGQEEQANLLADGSAPRNAACDTPVISGEGRHVLFSCRALEMGVVTRNQSAYFIYDRATGKTEALPDTGTSFAPTLTYHGAISSNGRFVAFRTGGDRIFIRDMVNKTLVETTAKYTVPSESPSRMFISTDGRYVTYGGRGYSSPSSGDAVIFDRTTGITSFANIKPDGVRTGLIRQASASDDASVISFTSTDGALTSPAGPSGSSAMAVYARDRSTGLTELVSGRTNATGIVNVVSGNGRFVAYLNAQGIQVYDRVTKLTRRVASSLGAIGTYLSISTTGRYVVFTTSASSGNYLAVADMGEIAGINLSTQALSLTEGGDAGTYSLVLTQVPDADVTVNLASNAQLRFARSSLTFTPGNWNVPQLISVQAVQNGVTEGSHSATVVHTVSSSDINYAVVDVADLTVTITDGVTPTVSVPGPTWNLPDMPVTGTAAPGATVILSAFNRTTGWMSAVSTVGDAEGKWRYTLTGFTDGVVELDAVADGLRSTVQTVTVKLATTTAPTYTDVTGYIRYTAYGLTYVRSTGKYAGDFVITNTGSIKLTGPLHLVLSGLTPGVTLINATGTIAGAPYITVSGDLEPDGSITIPLLVDNPNKVGVGYEAKIYSGKL